MNKTQMGKKIQTMNNYQHNENNMKINEGLRPRDLKDLVLPVISVDEYESRVSKKAIVIGFMVHDKEAAYDLNSFIQKSAITLLDTDVSPAPDQHGFYYVFVEFMNDIKFPKAVSSLIKEVEPLVDISKWKLRIRKTNKLIPFSEDGLIKGIERANRLKENKIYEFFENSSLNNLLIDETKIIMNEHIEFELYDFGTIDDVLKENDLDKALYYSFEDAINSNKILSVLGEGWSVDFMEDNVIIQNVNSEKVLLLKK